MAIRREKEIQRMAVVYKEKGMEKLFSIVEERAKRRGAEALRKEEYIFKHGDEYYVTKMEGSFFRDFSQSMN